MDSWRQNLEQYGWVSFPRYGSQKIPINLIVSELGAGKLQCSLNMGVRAESARSNTLSAEYGLGEFPMHTDRASDDVPPRYVLLAAPASRTTDTLVVDPMKLELIDEQLALRALFQIRIGYKKHKCRFLSKNRYGQFFRYNRQLMSPINYEAAQISNALLSASATAISICWNETRTLLMDNHRVLHGRREIKDLLGQHIRRLTVW